MISPEASPRTTHVWQAPQGFLRDAGIGIFDGINMCPDSKYYECIVTNDPNDPTKLVVTIFGKETNNKFVSLDADAFCRDITPLAIDNCTQHVIVEWDGKKGKDDRVLSLSADSTTTGPIKDMYPIVDCLPGTGETLCVADTEIYNQASDAPRIPLSTFVNALDSNSKWQGKINWNDVRDTLIKTTVILNVPFWLFVLGRQIIRDRFPEVQGREWKRKRKVVIGTKRQ